MRNKLIHAYSEVDAGIVWNVVERDLPVLERNVKNLMK